MNIHTYISMPACTNVPYKSPRSLKGSELCDIIIENVKEFNYFNTHSVAHFLGRDGYFWVDLQEDRRRRRRRETQIERVNTSTQGKKRND